MNQRSRDETIYQRGRMAAVLLSLIAYLPSITGRFIWDDWALTDGSAIGGGHSLLRCFTRPFLNNYYRPIVSASFFLENGLAHRTPVYFHQTNILIHLLTVVAIMAALRAAS